jgi:hypothetical protein
MYGTTHLLSSYWFLTSTMRPLSLLRYIGYESLPCFVSLLNGRGYQFLQDSRPRVQGQSIFNLPQGPCIIHFVTILYRSGYLFLSGSSALMRWSYCSGHVSLYLCSMIRTKWAWCKPPFLKLDNIHTCPDPPKYMLFEQLILHLF